MLSRALLLGGSPLSAFADSLSSHFDYVLVKDSHREQRLTAIADSLAEGSVDFGDLEALLSVADIGVLDVSLEESNVPENVRRLFSKFQREVAAEAGAQITFEASGVLVDTDDASLEQVVRYLIFHHRGSADNAPHLRIEDESDGTIAWLATAVPALEALRKGGLLVVDEIDASLHPHLLDLLLMAFADPDVNVHHAQLIFTSHESYILSPWSEVQLDPEQVWFTDKSYDGVTELFSHADFPKHPDANVAKRYLEGRYGGTPRLSPSLFAALVPPRGRTEVWSATVLAPAVGLRGPSVVRRAGFL